MSDKEGAMERPKRFEVGQRWKWLRVYAGEFTVSKVDASGRAYAGKDRINPIAFDMRLTDGSLEYLGMAGALRGDDGWAPGRKVRSNNSSDVYRLAEFSDGWWRAIAETGAHAGGSVMFCGQPSSYTLLPAGPVKSEGPVMAEGERVGSVVYPAACLQCGGPRGPTSAFECDACPDDGYSERAKAWINGDRAFPRKPKAPGAAANIDQPAKPCLKRGDCGSPWCVTPPAPKPTRIEVASDLHGRTRIDYGRLLDAEPADRYRWIWRDGVVDPGCAGDRARRATLAFEAYRVNDKQRAYMMQNLGNTTPAPPAPAPWRCNLLDEDVLGEDVR